MNTLNKSIDLSKIYNNKIIQILINVAVVTCSMPVTGMTLPFFSYGGTSLFINLCSMGIILNISKNCNKTKEQ